MKRFYSNERGRSLVLAFGLIILLITLATMTLVAANFGLKNTSYRGSSMVSVKNAETGLDELINNLEQESERLLQRRKEGQSETVNYKSETEYGNNLEKVLRSYQYDGNNLEGKVVEGTLPDQFKYAAFVKEIKKVNRIGLNETHPGRRAVKLVSYGMDDGVIKKIETEIEIGLVNYPSMFDYVLSSNFRGHGQLKGDEYEWYGPKDPEFDSRQGNIYVLGGPDIVGSMRIANSFMHNPFSFHYTYANPAEWGGGNFIYGDRPNWYQSNKQTHALIGNKTFQYKLPIPEKYLKKIDPANRDAYEALIPSEVLPGKDIQLIKHTRDKYSYRAIMEVNKLALNNNQKRFVETVPEEVFRQTMYKDLIHSGSVQQAEDDSEMKESASKGIVDAIDAMRKDGNPLLTEPAFSGYEPENDLFNSKAYHDLFSRNKEITNTCIKYGSDGKCHYKNSRKVIDLIVNDEEGLDLSEITDPDERLKAMKEKLEKDINSTPDAEEIKEAQDSIKAIRAYINGDGKTKGVPPESFTANFSDHSFGLLKLSGDYALQMYKLIDFKDELKEMQDDLNDSIQSYNESVDQRIKELNEIKKNAKWYDRIGIWFKVDSAWGLKKQKLKPVTNNKTTQSIVNDITTFIEPSYRRIPESVRQKVEEGFHQQPKALNDFYFLDKRFLLSNRLRANQLNSIVVAPASSKAGETEGASREKKSVLDYSKTDMVFGWNTRIARRLVNANTYKNGHIKFNRAYFGPPKAISGIDKRDEAKDSYPTRRLVIGYPNVAQIHNNLTLEGALFVEGDVTIRQATLNGRFLMYVDGNVEIDHSHFGYPEGHKSNGPIYDTNDAMFIFATGDVKIKNISHHRDKPSVFRGFIYSEGDIEIQGGDTNLNILGGVSGRDVFVSSTRGPSHPVIKINPEARGYDNYGVESFTHSKEQSKHIARVRLIHDPKIGEEYVKLMKQYGIDDKNIFEAESIPMEGQKLSTLRPEELTTDLTN